MVCRKLPEIGSLLAFPAHNRCATWPFLIEPLPPRVFQVGLYICSKYSIMRLPRSSGFGVLLRFAQLTSLHNITKDRVCCCCVPLCRVLGHFLQSSHPHITCCWSALSCTSRVSLYLRVGYVVQCLPASSRQLLGDWRTALSALGPSCHVSRLRVPYSTDC